MINVGDRVVTITDFPSEWERGEVGTVISHPSTNGYAIGVGERVLMLMGGDIELFDTPRQKRIDIGDKIKLKEYSDTDGYRIVSIPFTVFDRDNDEWDDEDYIDTTALYTIEDIHYDPDGTLHSFELVELWWTFHVDCMIIQPKHEPISITIDEELFEL